MKNEHLKKYWADVKAGLRPAPVREKKTEVTRRVRVNSQKIRGHELVVILHDHGELSMREPRMRGWYKISLAQCWSIAAINAANAQRSRVRELRKERGIGLGQARRIARKEIVGS